MNTREIEQAKLKANYWNGLAIATIAIGALPFFVGGIGTIGAEAGRTYEWYEWLAAVSVLAFTWSLSQLFHTLALRAVGKL